MKKTSKALALTIACLMVIMTALVCAPVYAATETAYELPSIVSDYCNTELIGKYRTTASKTVANFKTFFLVEKSSVADAVGTIQSFYLDQQSAAENYFKTTMNIPWDSGVVNTGEVPPEGVTSTWKNSRGVAIMTTQNAASRTATPFPTSWSDSDEECWFVVPMADANADYTIVISFVAPQSGTYSFKTVLDKVIPSADHAEVYEVYRAAGVNSKDGASYTNVLTNANKLASVTSGTGSDDYTLSGTSVELKKGDELWFTFSSAEGATTEAVPQWASSINCKYGTVIEELSVTLTAAAAAPDTADAGISIAVMAVAAAATGIVIVSKKRRNK